MRAVSRFVSYVALVVSSRCNVERQPLQERPLGEWVVQTAVLRFVRCGRCDCETMLKLLDLHEKLLEGWMRQCAGSVEICLFA